MATLVFLTGFEHGTLSTAGGGLFSALGTSGGTPTVVTSPVRNGTYALRIIKAGTGSSYVRRTVSGGASQSGVMRFAIRIAALPAYTQLFAFIDASTGSDCYFRVNESGQCQVLLGNATVTGPTLNLNQWYVIDLRFNPTIANGRTCDWRVDGVPQTQAVSTTVEAGSVITNFTLGSGTSADAWTAYYDDWACSLTAADYPLGDGVVVGLVPNGDGAHNTGAAGTFTTAGGAANVTDSTVTLYTHLWELPPSMAERVEQRLVGATNYVELAFTDQARTSFNGVRGVAAYQSSDTPANNATAKVRCTDGTETNLFSGDISDTTVAYAGAIITPPSGGWTDSAVDGLVARFGFATSVASIPYLGWLMIEVDSPVNTIVNVTASDTATLTEGARFDLSDSDLGASSVNYGDGQYGTGQYGASGSNNLSETAEAGPTATETTTTTDTARAAASLSGSDTAATVDTGALVESYAATDSAALTETGTVAAAAIGTDTATLAEGVPSVGPSSSDTGTLTDTGLSAGTLADSDSGTATDDGTVQVSGPGSVTLSSGDTAGMTDSSTLTVTAAGTDTATVTEGHDLAMPGADTFSLADTGAGAASLPDSDTATVADLGAVVIVIVDTDSVAFTDPAATATVAAAGSETVSLVDGRQVLFLDRSFPTYASTPDSAALSITGDIDLRCRAALATWTTAVNSQHLIAKRGSDGDTKKSYAFGVMPTGELFLELSADGTAPTQDESSVPTGFADGTAHWVRATWRASDGRLQFFTSDDGTTWAQLGVDGTVSVASIFDGDQRVSVGARSDGFERCAGTFYKAEIRNGIGGTVVANPDFTETTGEWDVGDDVGDTAADAAGNTWTLNGAALIVSTTNQLTVSSAASDSATLTDTGTQGTGGLIRVRASTKRKLQITATRRNLDGN